MTTKCPPMDKSEMLAGGEPYVVSVVCPACSISLNRATAAPGNSVAEPRAGDGTVCCGCCAALVYETEDDGALRLALFDESTLDDEGARKLAWMREVIARGRRNAGRMQ